MTTNDGEIFEPAVSKLFPFLGNVAVTQTASFSTAFSAEPFSFLKIL
jgi:hypothetical protein